MTPAIEAIRQAISTHVGYAFAKDKEALARAVAEADVRELNEEKIYLCKRIDAAEARIRALTEAAEPLIKRNIINIQDSSGRGLYPDWLAVSHEDHKKLRDVLAAPAEGSVPQDRPEQAGEVLEGSIIITERNKNNE